MSDEGAVMGLEQRGGTVRLYWRVNREREEPFG